MRLRQSIATPDRFDEAIFKTKRRESTKPQYPELLSKQVVPFNSNNRPAAFPSLPLNLCQLLGGESVLVAPESFVSHDEQESMVVYNGVNSTEKKLQQSAETCDFCKGKIRTSWRSLSLSVQIHIFNHFLGQERYAADVAASLDLAPNELDGMMYHLNIRHIYHASTEDVWSYGAAISSLGPNVIDPTKIEDLMSYWTLAAEYEYANENDVNRGKRFLKERKLDHTIMDLFQDCGKNEQSIKKKELKAEKSCNNLKRRRNAASRTITIDTAKANTKSNDVQQIATAPAAFMASNEPDASHETVALQGPHIRKPHSANAAGFLGNEADKHKATKRMCLVYDDRGHASIAADDENELYTSISRPRSTTDMRTLDTLVSSPFQADPEPIEHRNHNRRAFAAHFGNITFPTEAKTRLLAQDPATMCGLDHWLVYGSWWPSIYHTIEFGLILKPVDSAFDPRKTTLDGGHLGSSVLQALVELHNDWVRAGRWQKADCKELSRQFDLTAETVMEKAMQSQIGITDEHSTDPKIYDPQEKPSKHNTLHTSVHNVCRPAQRLEAATSTSGIVDDSQLVRPHKSKCELMSVSKAAQKHQPSKIPLEPYDKLREQPVLSGLQPELPPLGMTPDHRHMHAHTGDTTIAVLSSTTSDKRPPETLIEPGNTRRKLFECSDIQALETHRPLTHHSKDIPRTPPLTIKTQAPESKNKSPVKYCTEAPDYSPISEQNPDTIPVWARHERTEMISREHQGNRGNGESTLPPFARLEGSKMENNKLLQGFIAAAAEDVLESPKFSKTQTSPSKMQASPQRCIKSDVSISESKSAIPQSTHTQASEASSKTVKKTRKDKGKKRGPYNLKSKLGPVPSSDGTGSSPASNTAGSSAVKPARVKSNAPKG